MTSEPSALASSLVRGSPVLRGGGRFDRGPSPPNPGSAILAHCLISGSKDRRNVRTEAARPPSNNSKGQTPKGTLDAALPATRRDDLRHGTNAAYVHGCVLQRVPGPPAGQDGEEPLTTSICMILIRVWERGDSARH